MVLSGRKVNIRSVQLHGLYPRSYRLLLFSTAFSSTIVSFTRVVVPGTGRVALHQRRISISSVGRCCVRYSSCTRGQRVLSLVCNLLAVKRDVVFVTAHGSTRRIQTRVTTRNRLISLVRNTVSPRSHSRIVSRFHRKHAGILLTAGILTQNVSILRMSLIIGFSLPRAPRHLPSPRACIRHVNHANHFKHAKITVGFIRGRLSHRALRTLRGFFNHRVVQVPARSLRLLRDGLRSVDHNGALIGASPSVPHRV